jgi:hypothetical protein
MVESDEEALMKKKRRPRLIFGSGSPSNLPSAADPRLSILWFSISASVHSKIKYQWYIQMILGQKTHP